MTLEELGFTGDGPPLVTPETGEPSDAALRVAALQLAATTGKGTLSPASVLYDAKIFYAWLKGGA